MRRLIAAAVVLMCCFSGGALAQQQRFGNWTVELGGGYSEAYTGNDSGSAFGLFCGADSCTFYLDTGDRCNESANIPVLINSDSGSTYAMGACVHIRTGKEIRYINSIQDKDIVTAISSGRVIGFAIPMKSGDFKVVRFSLDGAITATGRAVAGTKGQPRGRDTGLRDRTF